MHLVVCFKSASPARAGWSCRYLLLLEAEVLAADQPNRVSDNERISKLLRGDLHKRPAQARKAELAIGCGEFIEQCPKLPSAGNLRQQAPWPDRGGHPGTLTRMEASHLSH